MADRWRVTVTYVGRMTVRKLNRHVRAGLQMLIVHWHKNLLKKHFQQRYAGEYHYEPRKVNYDKLKMRLAGKRVKKWKGQPVNRPYLVAHHQPRPIVFTGDTRRMALLRVVVSGTRRSAKGALTVPWYIKHGNQAERIQRELLATSPREAARMAKMLDKFLAEAAKSESETERKTLH